MHPQIPILVICPSLDSEPNHVQPLQLVPRLHQVNFYDGGTGKDSIAYIYIYIYIVVLLPSMCFLCEWGRESYMSEAADSRVWRDMYILIRITNSYGHRIYSIPQK